MTLSIIAPKRPREGSGWHCLAVSLPTAITLGFEAQAWQHKARGPAVVEDKGDYVWRLVPGGAPCNTDNDIGAEVGHGR